MNSGGNESIRPKPFRPIAHSSETVSSEFAFVRICEPKPENSISNPNSKLTSLIKAPNSRPKPKRDP